MKYLILNEKNSAMRNFSTALGGNSGHFADFDYQLAAARGHLLTLMPPENQTTDQDFADKVAQWSNTQTIPWHLDRFNWKKTYIVGTNYRTHRKESTKALVDNIKAAAVGCDAIVIATDDDPSGEGDVLGQEIVNQINWKGKVLRCRFADESKPSIQKALTQLEDVTNTDANHKYARGLAREQFDYATMQMSRLATQFVREQNYDVLVTPGRLKSAIIEMIYQQLRKRDTFTPQDQFQAIFKDENGNNFMNSKAPKYDSQALAGNDLTQLTKSTVTVESAKRKSTHAPKMMNFAQIGIALSKTKASLKQITQTYQQMYEQGYVSYPRTEDTAMTKEQWDQLVAIADPIASVIGVDINLLTQKNARAPFVTSKPQAHGANRPGLTVPNSLSELKAKFGDLGVAIYTTLAKSYLATLAADYEYDATKAFVTDYPAYTATKNVMAKPGYKAILADLEAVSEDDDAAKDAAVDQFGQTATPTINVTKTTAPSKPSKKFILNYLTKNNVGTGATQVQTLSALMDGKRPVVKQGKGQLELTPEGIVAGAIMQDTMLATPEVTKQLNEMAKQVGDHKIPLDNIYKAVNMIIQKDRDRMEQNAKKLDDDSYLNGKLPPKSANQQAKFHGTYKGQDVSFKKIFMGHRFEQAEADALLNGDTIQIEIETKRGTKKKVSGHLAQQSFKSKKDKKTVKYWGFYVDKWL